MNWLRSTQPLVIPGIFFPAHMPAPVFAQSDGDDEQASPEAFTPTMEVRKLRPSAKSLADRYFFDTPVRLYRAGAGASYTGLKPAGRDLGSAIPAADRAIEQESPQAVEKVRADAAQERVREHLKSRMAAKNFGKK